MTQNGTNTYRAGADFPGRRRNCMKKEKLFDVEYVSRYYPFEGIRHKRVYAPSASWIRNNWHSIIHTDEYRVKKCTEVKEALA